MPRFAANLAYLFTERPFMERFGAAAAAGFKAVELQMPYDHAPRRCAPSLRATASPSSASTRRRGRTAGKAVSAPCRGASASSPRCLRRRSTTWWRSAARRSTPWPARSRPSSARRPSACSSTIYARAADLAAEKNITLLIEPINPRDRPDYFLNRVEQAADIIAKVGRPNVRIQFDFYHVQIVSGDLLTRFEKHLPLIGHVQIAAVPSRAEPDEGEVNYPAVFEALDRLGYAGWVGCEYKPRGRTEDGLGGQAFGLGVMGVLAACLVTAAWERAVHAGSWTPASLAQSADRASLEDLANRILHRLVRGKRFCIAIAASRSRREEASSSESFRHAGKRDNRAELKPIVVVAGQSCSISFKLSLFS